MAYAKVPQPATVEEFRKMIRCKAAYAAQLYGLSGDQLSRLCCRKMIPGAVKLGRDWMVTPQGMDKYFADLERKQK